jgi:ankyrin repeat protein
MYRSILYQLLTRFPHLQSVFVLCPPKMSDEGILLWDMETLKTLFSNALEQLGEESLICVIDALDECPEDQVREMIFFFERLGNLSTSCKIRTFFSSRHYPNITIQHSIVLILDDHSGHRGDIVKYVNSKLRIPGQPNLTDDLRAEIYNRSSGIFLWVILVIEILKKIIDRGRVHQLKKRLETMPSGLDDLFNDILSRDTENMQDLILCLQWLCFAHQPLNPEQFYHAVLSGSEPGFPSSVDPEQINQHNVYNFVLDSSKGLAEITKTKAPTVQFIHESVREYLLKAGGLQKATSNLQNFAGQSHDSLKRCCEQYIHSTLSLPEMSPKTMTIDQVDRVLPFLRYAVREVIYHANSAEQKGVPQDDFLKKLDLKSWIEVSNFFERYPIRHYSKSASPLYIFANERASSLIHRHSYTQFVKFEDERFGHPLIAALVNADQETIQALLEKDIWQTPSNQSLSPSMSSQARESTLRAILETEIEGLERQNVFSWALRKNKAEVAKQILNLNIKFEFSNGQKISDSWSQAISKGHSDVLKAIATVENPDLQGLYEDTFTEASKAQNWAIVRLFSDLVVDKNALGSALIAAAKAGEWDMVRLLLNQEANVDTQKELILVEASKAREWETVQLLLSQGADVNTQNGFVLVEASKARKWKIVRFLLCQGADVNTQNGLVLVEAFKAREWEIVRLLLSQGADINTQKDFILVEASRAREWETVQLLLSQGADVNTQSGFILVEASKHGEQAVIEMLLAYGANVNAQGERFGNALQAASKRGYLEIVKVLLEHEANVNADGGRLGNALQLASKGGHLEVVIVLLEHGANVNAKGYYYDENALRVASEEGHLEVVKVLLEHGASVNAHDGYYHNALRAASRQGHLEVVNVLLKHGANVNSQDGWDDSALQVASRQGHLQVVEVLLKHGADVNGGGGHLDNALRAASRQGHLEVVKVLLEYGAITSAQGRYYGSALEAASEGGHVEVMRVLLSHSPEVYA